MVDLIQIFWPNIYTFSLVESNRPLLRDIYPYTTPRNTSSSSCLRKLESHLLEPPLADGGSGLRHGRRQSIALARERTGKARHCIPVNDRLHRDICAHAKEVEADDDQRDVDNSSDDAPDTLSLPPSGTVVCLAHTDVCGAPEDPAEEGIEERGHQRQQVGEEGDNLSDDEGEDPQDREDASPCAPSK